MNISKESLDKIKELVKKYVPTILTNPILNYEAILLNHDIMTRRQTELSKYLPELTMQYSQYKERVALYFTPNNKRKCLGLPMRRGIVNKKSKI